MFAAGRKGDITGIGLAEIIRVFPARARWCHQAFFVRGQREQPAAHWFERPFLFAKRHRERLQRALAILLGEGAAGVGKVCRLVAILILVHRRFAADIAFPFTVENIVLGQMFEMRRIFCNHAVNQTLFFRQ